MLSDTPTIEERRLRVLVIPEQFPQGPADIAGIFVRDYVDAIKQHCNVVVLLPGNDRRTGVARLKAMDGVEFVRCTPALRGGSARRQKLGRIEGLYRLGRTAPLFADVDLIHAHGAVFHGVPAARLGRRLGVPVVLTVHANLAKLLKKRTTRFLTGRTLERVDCVCAVSEDHRRQIEESGIRPKRVEVTYNPVDTQLFRPVERGLPFRRIVFAGRLEEYKGALRVVRAFAEAANRLPGWTLTIAGDGPELPTIEAFLATRPILDGRVDLLGLQTKAELAGLYASSDFFVYPSRRETFGIVIAEAMSAGLPVIAPDRTAPPEFVDRASGILVSSDDIPAIARAIVDLAEGHDRFDRAAIRERIVRRFGFDAFGQRLLQLYRGLTQERAKCAE